MFLVYDATHFSINSTKTDLPEILRFYFANWDCNVWTILMSVFKCAWCNLIHFLIFCRLAFNFILLLYLICESCLPLLTFRILKSRKGAAHDVFWQKWISNFHINQSQSTNNSFLCICYCFFRNEIPDWFSSWRKKAIQMQHLWC